MRKNTLKLAAACSVALAIAGCGKGDGSGTGNTSTGTGTGATGTGTGTGATGTGTGAGTGTGTGNAGTDAFARMVHLIYDAGPVDLYVNNNSMPLNTDPFVVGANTDGSPVTAYNYAPFPSPIAGGTPYNLKLRDAGAVDVLDYDTDPLQIGVQYTILAIGFSQPPGSAAAPTMGLTIDDASNNAPAAGMHALTMYGTLPGVPTFDVFVCAPTDADSNGVSDPCDTSGTADATGLTYPQWTAPIEKAGGQLVITAAIGGYPIMGWEVTAPADGWSYLYVLPNPVDPVYGTPWLLHHVLGSPNNPVANLAWP